MHGLFIWLVGFAAFLYLIAPILVRFTQKMNAHPRFQSADLSALPEPAAHYLWSCQQALESEGFETIAHLSWSGSAANVFPLLTLTMNRQTGVKAMAAAIYAISDAGPRLASRHVEFITRYEDGVVLGTSNAALVSAFQHGPNQQTLRLPEMQNPHELYAVHCRRMAQRSDSILSPLPLPGAELPYQEALMTEDYEEQVGFGRLYLDHALGVYRPTWKGAYLMTWSQLWPMKALKKAQARREAQAELQSLGSLPLSSFQR